MRPADDLVRLDSVCGANQIDHRRAADFIAAVARHANPDRGIQRRRTVCDRDARANIGNLEFRRWLGLSGQ